MKKIFSFCLLFGYFAHAQEKNTMPLEPKLDSITFRKSDSLLIPKGVDEVDLFDLAKKIFGSKPSKKKKDSVFVKPELSAVPAVGYTLTTRFAGTISGNMVFRTSSDSKASTISASTAYTQNRQFTVPVESSIWLKNDKYNLVGDYRLYKYPQTTFGLGSDSWIGDKDPMDFYYFRFYELLMRRVVKDLYIGAGYIIDQHWGIEDMDLNRQVPPDSQTVYNKYGESRSTISSGFTINALYDHRDYSIYPTQGFYANIQYRNSLISLGSTSNWQSLIVDLRKYYPFPASSKGVLALWSYNWLIIGGKAPYLDLPSTSWDPFSSTGRGYIQGRFRGAQMVYQEAEYRFQLSQNGLLGGVVFINAQTFSAAEGTALQKLQPGYGLGARIKLNKVSKTNICIDYGFGTQGSNGLFINIAEIF